MAIKTQLRTAQLTGSFGNAVGLIGDQLANGPSGSASADDLAGVLSQMASSIRRVNGATSFTDGALGVFNLATADFSNDLKLSSDAAVLSLGAGSDVSITHDGTNGGTLASAGAFIIDSTASTLLLDGNSGVSIAGNAAEVDITTTGAVDINSGVGTWNASTLDLDTSSTFDIDATGAVTIDSDAGVTIGGSAVDVDADGGVLSLDGSGGINIGVAAAVAIDIDASTLDIDATGAVTIDSATSIAIGAAADKPIDIDSTTLDIDASGAITIDGTSTIGIGAGAAAGDIDIGTNATAREVTIGNTTGASGVTINCGSGNVDIAASSTMTTVKGTLNVDEAVTLDSSCVIAGDLTVNGTTTTVNSQTLLVKDPVIAMGVGAQTPNSNGGLAIMSGSNAGSDLVFGRVANDTFGVGILDTQSGSIASVAGMAVTNFRASVLEVGGATNYLDVSATNLRVIAAADIILDPVGGDVKVDGNLLPLADDGGALGAAGTEWKDLFLNDAGVINWDGGNSTLTGGSSLLNSNVPFRATKLEIDGASNNIDVATNMIVTAVADIDLRSGANVKVRGGGTNDFLSLQRASATVAYINFAANDGSGAPLTADAGFGFRNNGGTMQFKSNGGSWQAFTSDEVTESKTVKELATTVGPDTRIFGTGNGFDCSDIVATTNNRVDVFVNGQMLVSSSMVTGDGDYSLSAADGAADMDILLKFAVVDDDIVQVVVR